MRRSNPFSRGFAWLAVLVSIGFSPGSLAATPIIDILVVYDTSAAAWVQSNGGSSAFAADVINRMNQVVQNSGIVLQFRLVKTMDVAYTTTAGPFTPPADDLAALRDGTGPFVAVHAARDQAGADLVAMLIDTGYSWGYTGVGCLLFDWNGYDGCAFSVNAIQSVAISHTLTHEVGHILGADHAKSQLDSPGPNGWLDGQYSAGWYFTGKNGIAYHTIMAYDDDGHGNHYQEAPVFSTPLVDYQGTVAGDAEDGDNSRLIRETMGIVAAYRSGGSPVTATLSITSSGATGLAVSANPSNYGGTTNYVKSGIPVGTQIELTAPVSANTGDFINWAGCDTAEGTNCTVTLAGDRTVTANYPAGATLLTNGQAVSNISGVSGSQRFFRIEVSAGSSELIVKSWGGEGDADLYVKRGQLPTLEEYDCRPFSYGNDEICTFPNPSAGTYFVMLAAGTDFSGLSLMASVTTSNSYSVTATAGTGGAANCNPPTVSYNGSSTCVATPNAGYAFSTWTGACADQGAVCTLMGIQSDQVSGANFTVIQESFKDVPSSHWAFGYINAIRDAGITNGCGNNNYCPTARVTRDQMAAFLVRAIEGDPQSNLCAAGSPFSDVPWSVWYCSHVKRLVDQAITGGCGQGKYCPGNLVTREQMAAFIVRSVAGEPPQNYCGGVAPFKDVSPSSWSCGYIKKLIQLGITQGCGNGSYCPGANVDREQMAAFLARAFLGMD